MSRIRRSKPRGFCESATVPILLRCLTEHWKGPTMNITDLPTRADALNERTRLVTRTIEPDETPILRLLDTDELRDAPEAPDPLIQALMDKLPKPNAVWSIDDRGKWLKAAAMAFNLIYRTAEQKPEQTMASLKSVG
jgi:hypothetical protein